MQQILTLRSRLDWLNAMLDVSLHLKDLSNAGRSYKLLVFE